VKTGGDIMENIIRDLKYARFELDRDNKTVTIKNKISGEQVTLNKVYTFSLFRALVSFTQKLTVMPRKVVKVGDKR